MYKLCRIQIKKIALTIATTSSIKRSTIKKLLCTGLLGIKENPNVIAFENANYL